MAFVSSWRADKMASGSNAPFSGEFNDLKNTPTLPKGISAENILENNADLVRQVAEARHKSGLSQVNADGGFFDAFVDTSKIKSSSNVRIGKTLKLKRLFIDNFEDGNLSEWTINVGSSARISTTTTNPIESENSLRLNADNRELELERTFGPIKPSSVSFEFKFSETTEDEYDVLFSFELHQTPTDRVTRIGVDGRGELEEGFNPIGLSLAPGEVHKVKIDSIDFSAETFDVIVNGTNIGQFNFDSGTVTEIDRVVVSNDSTYTGSTFETRFDSLTDSTKGFKTSGEVTEKEFLFRDIQGQAFSPSKVGIFPDQTLNGQSITFDLKDSSGKVVNTFQQSDLNQLIDVNTTDDTFQVEVNFSGDGTETPILEFLDMRGV